MTDMRPFADEEVAALLEVLRLARAALVRTNVPLTPPNVLEIVDGAIAGAVRRVRRAAPACDGCAFVYEVGSGAEWPKHTCGERTTASNTADEKARETETRSLTDSQE